MDISKITLFLHTLRFLKPIQVYYRFFYLIRKLFYRVPRKEEKSDINYISFHERYDFPIYSAKTYFEPDTFNFLNQKKTFSGAIDWNYLGYGKLWCYNLNYFEFLEQKDMSKEFGLNLILSYIKSEPDLKDGLEPYPISLRIINWFKFLTKHQVANKEIHQSLKWYSDILYVNIEYHILGNHILENGFALLFSAHFFRDPRYLKKAKNILQSELNEQILSDGAHFEQSPMYHQIILYRLLDAIYLIEECKWVGEMSTTLRGHAAKMLTWLMNIGFSNGQIPLVNDSASGIAPETSLLVEYARQLNIFPIANLTLGESGYRMIRLDHAEVLFDVGNITATYQAGHHHSDALQVLLNWNNQPILVDTGVSTYEKNERRQLERSTSSHNTVHFSNENFDNVWGGFRTAQRSKVQLVEDSNNIVSASVCHYITKETFVRKLTCVNDLIIIEDQVSYNGPVMAFFHFHPDCKLKLVNDHSFYVLPYDICFTFVGAQASFIEPYNLATGYNQLIPSQRIKIVFKNRLSTRIAI
ncbi:heparinase II/III family protein [Nonlabens xiamenensis]|uniref:heparinase II/III family protein n=1 Tax=Nonlabens xiamenensis TaxID=2341043 RepID=UPI000F6068DA|nr:alginate lyase family protein [Nonlabens xiamenensis]